MAGAGSKEKEVPGRKDRLNGRSGAEMLLFCNRFIHRQACGLTELARPFRGTVKNKRSLTVIPRDKKNAPAYPSVPEYCSAHPGYLRRSSHTAYPLPNCMSARPTEKQRSRCRSLFPSPPYPYLPLYPLYRQEGWDISTDYIEVLEGMLALAP